MNSKSKETEYILFTSNNFPAGGPGASYLNLFCKGIIAKKGHIKVYLFKGHIYKNFRNTHGRKNKTEYGVKFTHLGFANRAENHLLKFVEDTISVVRTVGVMFRLIFIRKKITLLIYSNSFPFNLPIYLISRLFHISLVSFVPEFLEKHEIKKSNAFEKVMFYSFMINYSLLNKMADGLIVFSDFLKQEYIRKGYNTKNIYIQPNLTDFALWQTGEKQIEYTIGYAGTPSKKDGIFDLLDAIKLLKEKGTLIKALIIGDSYGTDSLIPIFKEKCRELQIVDQVTFTGLVSQESVVSYLNKCQILSITRPNTRQTNAGFPTKLGEYMACKQVVLATKFGDIERYFSDKKDIVLAQPEDAASIAQNIEWILDNPSQALQIADQGFLKAKKLFDYRPAVSRIDDFIKEVINAN